VSRHKEYESLALIGKEGGPPFLEVLGWTKQNKVSQMYAKADKRLMSKGDHEGILRIIRGYTPLLHRHLRLLQYST
jgi:hypothetical protein